MFPLFSPSGQDGCDHDDTKRTPSSHTPFMCAGTSPDSRTRVVGSCGQLESFRPLTRVDHSRSYLNSAKGRRRLAAQKSAVDGRRPRPLRTLCVCDPLHSPAFLNLPLCNLMWTNKVHREPRPVACTPRQFWCHTHNRRRVMREKPRTNITSLRKLNTPDPVVW